MTRIINSEEGIITYAFKYAKIIFDYMYDRSEEVDASTIVEFGYPAQPGEKVRLFSGLVRKEVGKALGLSSNSTGASMSLLNAMRATTMIYHSGGKGRKSIYILHYKPTNEQYFEFKERQGQLTRRIAPSKFDSLIGDVADLRIRVKNLEEQLSKLTEVTVDRNNV